MEQTQQQPREEDTHLTAYEAKNIALTNNAVQLLKTFPNISNQQIADELGISRTTLWNLLKGEYAQELLRRELHEQETILQEMVEELWNPRDAKPNPTNQRTAANLRYKIAENISNKLRPTKTQNININTNTENEEDRMHRKITEELLTRLPTQTYNLCIETWRQIQKEWGWNTPPHKE